MSRSALPGGIAMLDLPLDALQKDRSAINNCASMGVLSQAALNADGLLGKVSRIRGATPRSVRSRGIGGCGIAHFKQLPLSVPTTCSDVAAIRAAQSAVGRIE